MLANFKNLPLPTPVATPVNQGQYKLKIKGTSGIKAGNKFKINLSGASENYTYMLSARLNNTDCEKEVVFSGSGADESRSLKGKFPKKISGKIRFIAGIQNNDSEITSKVIKIKKTAKLKKKKEAAYCSALMNSLK